MVHHVLVCVSSPFFAVVVSLGWNWKLLDTVVVFEDIRIKATREMPSDMAVERPNTRVVRVPLDDLITSKRAFLALRNWDVEVKGTPSSH